FPDADSAESSDAQARQGFARETGNAEYACASPSWEVSGSRGKRAQADRGAGRTGRWWYEGTASNPQNRAVCARETHESKNNVNTTGVGTPGYCRRCDATSSQLPSGSETETVFHQKDVCNLPAVAKDCQSFGETRITKVLEIRQTARPDSNRNIIISFQYTIVNFFTVFLRMSRDGRPAIQTGTRPPPRGPATRTGRSARVFGAGQTTVGRPRRRQDPVTRDAVAGPGRRKNCV